MLDRLEAEIISLRERAGAPAPPPVRNRKAKRKHASAKKAKQLRHSKAERIDAQESLPLAPPENTPPAESTQRIVGKRQALGRSLLQLRKMTARAAGLGTAEDNSEKTAENGAHNGG